MSNIGILSGGASGSVTGQLDVQWIVEQLIAAKQQPIKDLETYEIFYKAKKEAFQELNTRVSALESALYKVNTSGFDAKGVTLNTSDYLAASASSSASPGLYSIIVQQLATAQSDASTGLSSATDPLLSNNTFQIWKDASKTTLLGEVDYSSGTLSLNGLKNAVNDLNLGIDATVIRYGDNDYRLHLTASDTGAANGFFVEAEAALGWSTKIAAVDAQVYVNSPDDNINYISRSLNTMTDVIPGVTLNLKQADDSKSTLLTIGSDTGNLEENIQSFADAFNNVMNYLNTQFTFDEEKQKAGVLSGESAALKIKNDLLAIATSRVQGVNAAERYKSLSVIGIELNRQGQLEIDAQKLDDAIANHLDAVKRIFKDVGTVTHSEITFVGKTDETAAGSYAVKITQAAQQAVAAGSTAADTLTGPETLTIWYKNNEYQVALANGWTSSQVVAEINEVVDEEGAAVFARVSGTGNLEIVTDEYGSSQTVKVKSDRAAGVGTTGIGTVYIEDAGQNVAGTIGGNAASGSGRTLTGTAGDSKGLMLYVTTTSIVGGGGDDKGEVYFTRGVAETLRERMYEISFPYTGLLAKNIGSFDDQLENIALKIKDIKRQLQSEQEILIAQFTRANEALAQMTYLLSTISNNFAKS
ncbi:MAG TPA: flagellar filament capping protein FliD [Candidatus Deferrimicrobium sp.]|nr:flagellar filament capping protein FliD [Candidatus Deferrimicrobium sp.]